MPIRPEALIWRYVKTEISRRANANWAEYVWAASELSRRVVTSKEYIAVRAAVQGYYAELKKIPTINFIIDETQRLNDNRKFRKSAIRQFRKLKKLRRQQSKNIKKAEAIDETASGLPPPSRPRKAGEYIFKYWEEQSRGIDIVPIFNVFKAPSLPETAVTEIVTAPKEQAAPKKREQGPSERYLALYYIDHDGKRNISLHMLAVGDDGDDMALKKAQDPNQRTYGYRLINGSPQILENYGPPACFGIPMTMDQALRDTPQDPDLMGYGKQDVAMVVQRLIGNKYYYTPLGPGDRVVYLNGNASSESKISDGPETASPQRNEAAEIRESCSRPPPQP